MKEDIEKLGKSTLYSEELGIKLGNKDDELFKWFLASTLFGGRISETIAKNTYKAFGDHNLLTPESIMEAGFDFLVNPIMREGGYVRYDGRESTQILRNCKFLLDRYKGSLSSIHDQSSDCRDLEKRLAEFYGVGPVTVNIFLRELRPHWEKADPEPLSFVYEMADELGIDLESYRSDPEIFSRVECGLVRMRGERQHKQKKKK